MRLPLLSVMMLATCFSSGPPKEFNARSAIVSAFAQDPAVDPKAEYEKRKKEAEGSVALLHRLSGERHSALSLSNQP